MFFLVKRTEKYREELGSYQPVRLLFSPSGNYKFQVFIHKTVHEGQIDLGDIAAVERIVESLRATSGFVQCPGIIDYDDIISDIRIKPPNVHVKEELWPWRHVSAIKCKWWHKPRKREQLSEEMPQCMLEMCGDCNLVRRQLLVVRDKGKSLDEKDRLERQQASSKVRVSFLSPESTKARENNVRKAERKNFRQVAERMIRRTSMAVNDEQNSELVKLISCIESSKEGQDGLAKVFEEADKHKPGSGAIIQEMWQLEKEKNGKLKFI